MKKYTLQFLLSVFFGVLVLASCTKDYYDDGGLHNPSYNGTIKDFLKSRPELFDSLVKVIDMTEYAALLDQPDANVTFFAAANRSISNTVRALNNTLYNRGQDTVMDLRQIPSSVWSKYLSRYIYNDKYLLKDFAQIDTNDLLTYPGQGYFTIRGEKTNIGTFYNDVTSKNSAGVEQVIKYAGYRQVLINISNPVATSDIQPSNGIIHVLQFSKHTFGFYTYDFINDAIDQGINY